MVMLDITLHYEYSKYLHQTNTILFPFLILATKQAEFHLSCTIIGRINSCVYGIYKEGCQITW